MAEGINSLSNYSEINMMRHILGQATWDPADTIYLALLVANPGEAPADLSVLEPSGNNYARELISFDAPIAGSRTVIQAADIQFNTASGNWEIAPGDDLEYWAIFDASTVRAGNMLAYGPLTTPITVGNGNTPSVADQEVQISFQTGGISNYLAEATLNHIFRNASAPYVTPAGIHAGLAKVAIADADTGTSIEAVGDNKEFSMTSYARQSVGLNTNWVPIGGDGTSTNVNLIDFGTLTGTSETVEGLFLADAATGGNLLFYDNTVSQPIGDGHIVQVPIGDFDLSMT